MQRFLKKMGTNELRLYGYTPTLAAKKEMVECDRAGKVLGGSSSVKLKSMDALDAFELGVTFQVTGKKSLRSWIASNTDRLNAAGIHIQALIISKWQKYFGDEPMPISCTFIVTSNFSDNKTEAEPSPSVDTGM